MLPAADAEEPPRWAHLHPPPAKTTIEKAPQSETKAGDKRCYRERIRQRHAYWRDHDARDAAEAAEVVLDLLSDASDSNPSDSDESPRARPRLPPAAVSSAAALSSTIASSAPTSSIGSPAPASALTIVLD